MSCFLFPVIFFTKKKIKISFKNLSDFINFYLNVLASKEV